MQEICDLLDPEFDLIRNDISVLTYYNLEVTTVPIVQAIFLLY